MLFGDYMDYKQGIQRADSYTKSDGKMYVWHHQISEFKNKQT